MERSCQFRFSIFQFPVSDFYFLLSGFCYSGFMSAKMDGFSHDVLEFPAVLELLRSYLSGAISEPVLYSIEPNTRICGNFSEGAWAMATALVKLHVGM